MNIKPLNQVSYSSTSATVFQYAVAGFACDITANDADGDYLVVLKYQQRTFWFSVSREKALSLPERLMKRYPVKPFDCQVDY